MNFVYNSHDDYTHSHAATLAEHKEHVYLAWYSYQEKEHEKGQITVSKYDQKTNTWSKGKFIFPNHENTSFGNPILFSFAGKLHMYFVILIGAYWDSASIHHSVFDEESDSWSAPQKVNTKEGIMVRHRPLIIDNDFYIPAYDEETMSTIIYRANDNSLTSWSEYSKVPGSFIQGDLFHFNDNEWQMFLRAAGDNTHVMRTLSADKGKSWSNVMSTSLWCPLSGIAAIKLKSDNVLVCNNHTEKHKRTPISLSISKNKGTSFSHAPFDIESTDIELSYPSILEDSRGNIHIAYTYNRRMIKVATTTESELIEKMEDS